MDPGIDLAAEIRQKDCILGVEMANITFQNASVEIPIFNAKGRSFTSKVLQMATGGKLDADPQGHVTVRALQDINLEISEGDRVGLLGHNGAGKSTLLRVLSRAYAPSSGSAQISGTVGSLIDISLGINSEATGIENVFLRAALLGIPAAMVREKTEEIRNFSELGDFLEMPVRTYSSGMHLRLAFAVATLVTPEILLMDEWLSVGDEQFRHKAEARLKKMVDFSKILVIASHDRDLIEKTCNRAIWLEHGKIAMDGSARDVAAAYWGKS
jgi:lipopolysaccharide transport system ATP-binding protein